MKQETIHTPKTTIELVEMLEKAKSHVLWLLENPEGLADMHGLEYWAGVVERLRQEIKTRL
jgi:hypothetical protein